MCVFFKICFPFKFCTALNRCFCVKWFNGVICTSGPPNCPIWFNISKTSFFLKHRLKDVFEVEMKPCFLQKSALLLRHIGYWWHNLIKSSVWMIAVSFPSPQIVQRSASHFLDSLLAKVAKPCNSQRRRHTSWLYLFLWEISRSLNLVLSDPDCTAISLCKAPCNYKHALSHQWTEWKNTCNEIMTEFSTMLEAMTKVFPIIYTFMVSK